MPSLSWFVPRVAATVGVVTLAVGCSSGSSPSSSSSGSGSGATLVVYSAQGYDSAMTKAFSKATGIQTKLVNDSTGPLLTKIAAEGNNPQWGLLWVDGATAFAALDKQGKLLPYTPKATYTQVGQQVVPKDHSYSPTGVTTIPAVLYNAANGAKPPATYSDLLSAAFNGKVGMNDPSQSGPTFPMIAGLMNQLGGEANGVTDGEDYLKKLKANGLHVYPTNGHTIHAVQTGQITYGLIQSTAAEGEVAKAAKAPKNPSYDPKVVYIPKSTLIASCIGIDKAASPAVQDAAKKFVDYVLSPEGQKVMKNGDPTGDSMYYPIVPGVQPRAGVPAFPAEYQAIDPYYWGPLQSKIDTWFDTDIK